MKFLASKKWKQNIAVSSGVDFDILNRA